MKTKELSKQARDKDVDKYRSELGYKKISKIRPPKLMDQARRALIREVTKRPKITPKELQSSTEEIRVSVHRTTLSHTFHRAGLYGRVARKKANA